MGWCKSSCYFYFIAKNLLWFLKFWKWNYASDFIKTSELSAEINKICIPVVAESVNKCVVENKIYTKIGKISLFDIIPLVKNKISSSTYGKFLKWFKIIEGTKKVSSKYFLSKSLKEIRYSWEILFFQWRKMNSWMS